MLALTAASAPITIPAPATSCSGELGSMKYRSSGSGLPASEHGGQRQDKRHGEDDGQVEVQRTALRAAGDPDGDVVQRADGELVGAVARRSSRAPGTARAPPASRPKYIARPSAKVSAVSPSAGVNPCHSARCPACSAGVPASGAVEANSAAYGWIQRVHRGRPQAVNDGEEAQEGRGGEEGRPDGLERCGLDAGLRRRRRPT